MAARPRLGDYKDYRAFLRDFYAYEKSKDPAFSYGAFAKRAGLANRGHFKLVVDGKRDLTAPMVGKYVRGLALGPTDAECFRLKVALAQASPAGKSAAEAAYNKWVTEQKYEQVPIGRLGPDLEVALLILGMTFLEEFREDPAWIRERLIPSVPEERIRGVLGWLIGGSHLIRRRGRLVRGKPFSLAPSPADAPLLYGPFFAYAAQEGLRQPGHQAVQALLVLTDEQVQECGVKMRAWLREQILNTPPGRGGRLRTVLGGIFPLTKA